MATPKLSITLRNAIRLIDKLQRYKYESETLEARHQYFISEMIMLRLFSTFEDVVSEIAYKLAAGATYINGLTPELITRANSISGSRSLFLNFGRSKAIQNLKWTKAKYIIDSVKYVIPPTECFATNAQIYGATIEEMRKIRNVLAHQNSSAKADFKVVVRQTYGANINITTGAFLTTTRRTAVCNLNRYISSTKIIISGMASGQ